MSSEGPLGENPISTGFTLDDVATAKLERNYKFPITFLPVMDKDLNNMKYVDLEKIDQRIIDRLVKSTPLQGKKETLSNASGYYVYGNSVYLVVPGRLTTYHYIQSAETMDVEEVLEYLAFSRPFILMKAQGSESDYYELFNEDSSVVRQILNRNPAIKMVRPTVCSVGPSDGVYQFGLQLYPNLKWETGVI